ncbi:transmembrane protein 100-like [Osmerus eperlanus]|uniref:transmembrane protein 100-like n=1 Tax=Osmerus eperlanus TaxID=29151 RepID=UPI002E1587E8
MAHLFLAGKPSLPDDPAGKHSTKVPMTTGQAASDRKSKEKPNNKDRSSDGLVTTVPLINEVQLTAATGGAELSCYRCTVPFGVVVLIAGVVVTAVAYSFNSHGSTISVLGLVLLASGLGLLGSSLLCWRARQGRRRRERRRESQTALMAGQGAMA